MLKFKVVHGIRVAELFEETTHGRLKSIGPAFRCGLRTYQVFECRCGNCVVVLLSNVTSGRTNSCGSCERENLRKITAFGRTLSVREWSEEFGVSVELINSRLIQLSGKWTNERIVSEPVNVREPMKLNALGKSKTFREWSKETGLAIYTIRNRINCGWDPDLAVTLPVEELPGKKRGRKSVKEMLKRFSRSNEE